jgi:hypothetical protein
MTEPHELGQETQAILAALSEAADARVEQVVMEMSRAAQAIEHALARQSRLMTYSGADASKH